MNRPFYNGRMKGAWTSVEIGGKAADIYEPDNTPAPRFGILYLHSGGLERLHDRPAYTRIFDELKLVCVCPHGQWSWWADRVCAEFDAHVTPERHLLDRVLLYFAERW